MASTIIQEFIQALDEEIKASKKERIVKVFNGRFLREISGLFVYVFNLENFLVVLDETPAKIRLRGSTYEGEVLSTQGLEVTIGIAHFCGQFISEAELETDLSYLLEILKKKLADCQSGSVKIDFGLSEVLFSGSQSDSKLTNQTGISYSLYPDPPNEAQKQAIKASFSSQLSIIWGPPGTGKTRTVAKAIEAHLNAGRRVLLVSHANNAVDEALEDVAEHLKATTFYQEGKLVRLGKPQVEHFEKLERDYPLVLLDKIAAKLGESLTEEKNALESEKGQVEEKLAQFENAFRALQTEETLTTERDSLKSSVSESTRQLTVAQNELNRLKESQRKNRERLIEAHSAGALKRFFSGLDPQRIQRDIDLSSVSLDSKTRLVREMKVRLNELKHSYQMKEDEVSVAKREAEVLLQHLGISASELEGKKRESDQQKDTVLARIAEINRQLDEMQKNILAEARLVATTLTKTFVAKQFPDVTFDVLVLDEASMAPLPHLYWAAGRCREFITIVGDFLQLPPICIAKQPMAQKWLGRSIFEILGIRSVEGACRDSRVKLLDTQYRMVPEISAIPNRFFYEGILKDDPSTENLGLNDGVSESPLVLVETTAMNPWCTRLSAGSRFNLYNALVCATLAKRIVANIDSIRKDCKNPNAKVGIITPYKAQARLINKIARDWGLSDRLRISTIHQFQGGEEPIIIFDTTEGYGLAVAPMLDETKTPDSGARLVLDVAITRAESRLYLVAHTRHLLADLNRNSALSHIIRHFQHEAETLESETLVDKYFTTDFEKWADALLSTAVPTREPFSGDFYTERNFWAQFFQDLKTTKERLIIYSPFVTVTRTGKFMDYFRSMVNRGIKIIVHTWPSNQQQGSMIEQSEIVIRSLRDIGVRVVEGFHATRKHFKTAIIDNHILWDGSLNILSHKDTEEHMWRYEGSFAIEQVIKDLESEEENAEDTYTGEGCPVPG